MYHYTSKEIKIGDIITSEQSRGFTFAMVWGIYSRIYKKLTGKDFPLNYGYAYPTQRSQSTIFCYEVISESEPIRGNLHYSVYFTMDALSSIIDKNLPLKERNFNRDRELERRALKYFQDLDDESSIELISPNFKVIKKLTRNKGKYE